MAAQPDIRIDVRNEDEVAGAFKALEKQLRKDLMDDLKGTVRSTVVETAKDLVSVKTGRVQKSIGIGRTNFRTIEVRSRAVNKRDGYLYPVVLEYGKRQGGVIGPRAFLHPAAEQHQGKIEDELEDKIDQYAKRHDLL